MKKIVAYFGFISLLMALSGTFQTARAATPSDQSGPEVETQSAAEGRRNGFVTTHLDESTAVKAILGKMVGFSIVGDVIPVVSKDNELNYTDLSPFNTWLESPFRTLMPGYFSITNPFIPYTNKNAESGRYCARLVIDSQWTGGHFSTQEVTKPETVQVSDIPWSPKLLQFAQYLGTIGSGVRLPANAQGKLDLNLPPRVIAQISESDCLRNDVGVPHEPQLLGTGSHAQFPFKEIQRPIVAIPDPPFDFISKVIGGVVDIIKVLKLLGIKMDFIVTGKKGSPNMSAACFLTYGCKETETRPQFNKLSRTPQEGFFSSAVAYEQRRDVNGFGANENNNIKIEQVIGGGGKKDTMPLNNPEPLVNRVYETLRQGDCSYTAHALIPTTLIGGKIPIADACSPTPPAQCKVDTYNEILQKLPKTINATCTKYKDNLPISHEQCVGMMNEIFNIEIRNDPQWSGANYRCEHRPDSTAAGPFQIIDETYKIVTCDNERLDDDLKACKTSDAQLSRCTTQDAAELAMRVLLHYSNCKNVGKIASTAELYTAVCNYGTGTQELPWLNGQTYCEDVFHAAGIPIP